MRSYELPLLVYAPKHFKPRRVDTLMSQIDIVPTVLGLLNISYDSVSFGRDIFRVRPQDQFVLLSHNRDVTLYRPGMLVELGIRKASHTYKYDKASNEQVKMANDDTSETRSASSRKASISTGTACIGSTDGDRPAPQVN